MFRSLLLALSLFLLASATAQPYQYGCHYFRNKAHALAPLTADGVKALNASIARSDTFDIKHYDISIDVTDYTGQTLRAATSITFAPLLAGQQSVRFDLYQLTVDSVVQGGAQLPFTHSGEILEVVFASTLPVGVDQVVTVYYGGTPHRDQDWGGFYFESNYIYNLGIGLSTVPPNFGKVWYPCFDSFVERATYSYHVKSAGTYRAHCQGDFLGEVQLGGDTVIRSFDLTHPIPTHISAIAVADYRDSTHYHTGAYGTYPVTFTAKPAQLNAMVSKMGDTDATIDALEHWYGPYQYDRVGYVLTTDGALEIATNIAYPQFMTGQSVFDNRGLLAHEFGHQWWGNWVTPYNHNDMWLKEGPAEYSGHLVEEWVNGEAAFVDVVKDNHLFVLDQAHVQDNGFWPLSPVPDAEVYGRHTYYKGASVMHNLRGYMGDSLFRQAMRAVQISRAENTMTPEQFRDGLEAGSGVDLDAFFDAWVFAPGYATFLTQTQNAQPNGNGWEVDLTLRQRLRAAPAFHQDVPLDVTFFSSDWQREDHQVVADDEFTSLTLPCAFEPRLTVLNANNRLNQARMDHLFTIRNGQPFTALLPYVELRLYADAVVDSTLMYVEHVWAGPDHDQISWGIDEVSETHFWNFDGIWNPGDAFHARLNYDGNTATDLDHDLIDFDETDLILVHRATPSDPWEIYPYFTLVPGSLTDGLGSLTIDILEKGHYALAKGGGVASVREPGTEENAFVLFPVPAQEKLTVQGELAGGGTLLFDMLDMEGRSVQRSTSSVAGAFTRTLDVAGLPEGTYLLRVSTAHGIQIGAQRFVIMR